MLLFLLNDGVCPSVNKSFTCLPVLALPRLTFVAGGVSHQHVRQIQRGPVRIPDPDAIKRCEESLVVLLKCSFNAS